MFCSCTAILCVFLVVLQVESQNTGSTGHAGSAGPAGPAQPVDMNAQIIADLGSGKRTLLGLGIAKARFLVLIGKSGRESNPNNIYVYDPSLSSVDLDSTPPQISLTNGGPLSTKYPSVFKALQGATIRNRTVIINDATSAYILFASDTNGTQNPVLYSINEDKVISDFKGAKNLQTMLNLQFQVFTMMSTVEKMKFYSLVKYYFQPKYIGPDPGGNPKIRCIFEIDEWAFNGNSLTPKGESKLNRVYYQSSLCKDDNNKTVTVSKDCKYTQCLEWQMMAGFANARRIFFVGREMVHAVENVFSSSNIQKKQLSVIHFKMTDFFVPVKVTPKATLPPSTLLLIGVICVLLIFAIAAVTFWLCVRKNLFLGPGAEVAAPAGSSSRKSKSKTKSRRLSVRRSRSRKKSTGRSRSNRRSSTKRKSRTSKRRSKRKVK